MDERFKRNTVKCYIAYLLDKYNWEYDVDINAELNFILGNQEIFTKDKSIEELDQIIETIVKW